MTNIIGNISKGAETRTVEVGGIATLVTDFNLAENYTDRRGNKHTQFYRVSLWREPGAKLAQYLYAGRPVVVEGRVKARAYIDKDGKPQSQLELSNPRITFVTANNKGEIEAPAEDEVPFEGEE